MTIKDMTNNQCSCGLFIKELDDELYKTEKKIRDYNDKSSESDWTDIFANVDRIHMAMNTAEKACNINIKLAKEYLNTLHNSLPEIGTEQGRKESIGFIHLIHSKIYRILDNCIDK